MTARRSFLRPLAALAAIVLALSFRAGAPPASAQGVPGIDLANLDKTCQPCDDFFRFATGGWSKANTLPAGHPSWGSFNELQQDNQEALHTILEASAANTSAAPGSDEQKLGTFYRACANETAIEAAGTAPVDPLLAQIAAAGDSATLATVIGKLQRAGVGDGPGFSSDADDRDSSKTVAVLRTGGLGLPDRNYYVKTDEKTTAIRTAYRAYIATQLRNLGEGGEQANIAADAVLALETTLAKATPLRTEMYDPLKTYHPTAVADLKRNDPGFPWQTFFAAFSPPAFDTVNIVWPDFITAYASAFAQTPAPTWHEYLRFHLADSYATSLPKRFVDASFAFHSGVMLGLQQDLPRWQRCVAATDQALRTPLGQAYAEKYFTESAKARAVQMVDNLQATLRADIASLTWMSAATKQAAIGKLDALTKKIGYPDKWQDYSTLTIADGAPYAALVETVRTWNAGIAIARIGTATDRTRWGMTPPTVNAYYESSNNEVVFPAGILQPPFYNPQADDAVNYGGIGAVIGHEMTHGFDDSGRKYDANGNLRDWWTSQDAANFTARAQCITDEYNGFQPIPGVQENGKLVQGEAIADLGGLTIAYKAFSNTPEFHSTTKIDGYTPQQRFFLSYAQVWRSIETDGYARQLAATNEHADPKLRVNGTVSNMPAFAQAFMCPLRAAMVRNPRCEIW